MNWKDKFIITIQKQHNLVFNSQTIYDDETINEEISFEELITNQSLIARYVNKATEQEIAELIEKHGLELTERSLMTLLKTVRPLLIVVQHNQQLVKELFDKNLNLKNRFKGIYKKLTESVLEEGKSLYVNRATLENFDIEELTYETCLAVVQQNGEALWEVPKKLRTYDLCLVAVQQEGKALGHVPFELRTPDLCLAAVQQNGQALKEVPEKLKTPKLCLAAVQKNGKALQHVPKELRSPDLCLIAVKQNGKALWEVPPELKTAELCLAAVKQNWITIKDTPEKLRTPDLYLAAIEQNGHLLIDVPEELRTLEMCLAAIRQDNLFLSLIPKRLRTSDLYLTIVKQNSEALGDVPEGFETPEMCSIAVEQNWKTLRFVPMELRTPDLCLIAVKQNGEALGYVPEKLKTPKLCLDAIQQNGQAIYSVPPELKTPELCLAAVQQDGKALQHVPEELRTPELYLAAVEQNGKALWHVRWDLRTPEICLAAVKQNGEALKNVPTEDITPEICLAAVQQNGLALNEVPWKLRTPELFLAAVKQNGKALEYVPEEFKTPELCLAAVENYGEALCKVPKKLRTPDLCLIAVKQNGEALYDVPYEIMTPEIYFAFIKNTAPGSCKAFYKYFIIQMKEKISTLHDFENSFFTNIELISKQNSRKYHWDSFFGKFSSNNAMDLYKLFNKKKDLVDYQVDKIENIDALSSDGINNLYSTYIFPIKQAKLLNNAPRKIYDYLKTVQYLLDEGEIQTYELIINFSQFPAKSEIEEKHPVLKHRIMEINGFKFEILDRADETGLILGNLTGCCQKFGGANSDAVYDGFINPNSNFLAVYYGDRLVAQSWLRLGKSNVLYLDNIESNAPFSVKYEENFNKDKYELLKASYIEFAQTMKREYKLLNVIVGKAHSDVTFDELLLDTPTVMEDFVVEGEEELETDLMDDKNYVLAKKLKDITAFKTNIIKIVKGKRKL